MFNNYIFLISDTVLKDYLRVSVVRCSYTAVLPGAVVRLTGPYLSQSRGSE